MEAWAAVRQLHAQGHSVRHISRALHLSRQTVRRALGSPEPPRYQRKPTENQQLAPFVTLIQQMTTEQHLIVTRLTAISRLHLLVLDELGYLPMDPRRANLFFQLVSRLYERGSIILTTNKPFEEWGSVFGGDDVIAGAVLDRLLHHSHVIAINGPSFRTKDKRTPKSGGT